MATPGPVSIPAIIRYMIVLFIVVVRMVAVGAAVRVPGMTAIHDLDDLLGVDWIYAEDMLRKVRQAIRRHRPAGMPSSSGRSAGGPASAAGPLAGPRRRLAGVGAVQVSMEVGERI